MSVNLWAVVASVLIFVSALWYPTRMMRAVGQALEVMTRSSVPSFPWFFH